MRAKSLEATPPSGGGLSHLVRCLKNMKFGTWLCVLVLLNSGCSHTDSKRLHSRLEAIGRMIRDKTVDKSIAKYAMSRDFPDVVIVGPTLPSWFLECGGKITATSAIRIEKGDFFEKDPRVTHSIIIMEDDQSGLGLRMRYDPDCDKFHIVGYAGYPQPP